MRVLADTSAWTEYLRRTGSPANIAVRRLLASQELLVTDVVAMELMAGARDDADERRLEALLATAQAAPVIPEDWRAAARLQRRCRARGETVRRSTDCLIGAVALRVGVPVLHADADFEVLARHTTLRTVTG